MDELYEAGSLAFDAMYDFFDVPLIRSLVDIWYDGLTPRGRIDLNALPKKIENEGTRRYV